MKAMSATSRSASTHTNCRNKRSPSNKTEYRITHIITQIAGTNAGGVKGTVVAVEVIASDELTDFEQLERLRLERVIERSFYEAGKALQQLRDQRLYRSTHGTFEEYCNDRFGYN